MTIHFKEVGTEAVISAAYGGVVTWGEWYDAKRIAAGTLTNKAFYKKAGFYAYAVPGVLAVINGLFDIRGTAKYRNVTSVLANGFFYDAPRFTRNLMASLKTGAGMNAGRKAGAIAEANAIVAARRRDAGLNASQDQYVHQVSAPSMGDTAVPVVQSQHTLGGRGMLG
jgi:hypothetical protein